MYHFDNILKNSYNKSYFSTFIDLHKAEWPTFFNKNRVESQRLSKEIIDPRKEWENEGKED